MMGEQLVAVFIIVAHFTVMGYGGDALPRGKRLAFTSIEDCRKALPVVQRSFDRGDIPLKPDSVTCERLEIKR